MNEHQQHIKQWGADDFRRYHDGSMPQQEMYALEKAALDDSFLDDALQGYAYTKTALEDIAELKQRLQENKNSSLLVWYRRKPVVIFSRVAALLLLFAGITWVISQKNKTGVQQELATATAPATIQQQLPSLQSDSVKDITDMLPATETKVATALRPADNSKDILPSDPVVAAAPVAPILENALRTETEQINASKAKVALSMASEDRMEVAKELTGKMAGVNITPIKTVTGRIVDNKGIPVANAIIVNRQNRQNFTSDKEGNFSLNAANNIAYLNVDVNALGYESNSVELDSTGSNVVVLKEINEGLSEVVVTSGYEKKRTARSAMPSAAANIPTKTALLNNIKISNAAPYNGWDSLNKTAATAIAKLRKLQPSGEAKINFDVDAYGAPANIVVQPNACTSCVNELISFMNQLPPLQKVKKNKKLILHLQW